MPLRLYVAITDRSWFDLLRQKRFEDVNFWAPSGRIKDKLDPGDLFAFKLHAPDNYIVGAGIFSHQTVLPCSLAWETFAEANGASSLSEMRCRIARYRSVDPSSREDFNIGCRILNQPTFLPEALWIPVPASFHMRTMVGKGYETSSGDGRLLWEKLNARMASPLGGLAESQAKYGEPKIVLPRLGQGAFRILVTDRYARRCAVTGERTLPALDAAHIRPYAEGGNHEVPNGLLLRRDVHSLFDRGYVTISPDHRFIVSRRIKEEFENGRHYYAMHGSPVAVPDHADSRPRAELLSWHNEQKFLG
jgi:putative restriction endonuclease